MHRRRWNGGRLTAAFLTVTSALVACLMTNVGVAHATGTLTWTTRTAMPTPRQMLTVATDTSGAVYAIGGEDATHNGFATVERYDPSSDTWTTRAPMLTGLREPRAVRGTDGKIYVIGGGNYPAYDSSSIVQVYDPASNTWSPRSNLPEITQGSAGALGPDGKIYIFGGYPGCCFNYLHTVLAYDTTTDTWTTRAPMPTAREAAGAALAADGKIYVAGGAGSGIFNAMEAYDPVANQWTTKAPMPVRFSSVSLIPAPNGKLYAIGSPDGTVFEYDPTANTWATATPLPTHRVGGQATLAGNGRIYVLGGREVTSGGAPGAYLATNEEGAFGVPTSSSLTSSANPSVFGRLVTFTSRITPSGASGTVQFSVDGNPLGGSVTVSGGSATSPAIAGLSPGPHSVMAVFTGSSAGTLGSSASLTQTVGFSSTVSGSVSSLVVNSGQSVHLLNATVSGAVTVRPGGALFIDQSSVGGATTATGFYACASGLHATFVRNSTGFAFIGDVAAPSAPSSTASARDWHHDSHSSEDAFACAPNSINGFLQVMSNSGGVEVGGNSITGRVTVSNNSGSGPTPEDGAPEVEGNQIGGALDCSGNVAGFTDDGIPNSVSSARTGQCVGSF
jgi:N-acetylneuraminic acid mutarotase